MDISTLVLLGGPIAVWLAIVLHRKFKRSRPEAPKATIAKYPVSAKIVAGGFFGLLVVGAIWLGWVDAYRAKDTAMYAMTGAFCVYLAAIVADAWSRTVDWSSADLKFRSWRRVGVYAWSDIARLDPVFFLQGHAVRFRDNNSFYLPPSLAGIEDFMNAARANGVTVLNPA